MSDTLAALVAERTALEQARNWRGGVLIDGFRVFTKEHMAIIIAALEAWPRLAPVLEAATRFTDAWERDDEHALVVASQDIRDALRAAVAGRTE